MHVVFLGTGASEGIPALFCTCPLCLQARRREGRNVRSRAQQLIARRVLIDWPPDTFMHVQQVGMQLEQVDHVLFTHSHGDHCSPGDLFWSRQKGFSHLRDGPPLHVWAEPAVLAKLGPGDPAERSMIPHEIRPFESYDLGDGLSVTPIRAHHTPEDDPTANFLFADADGVYLLGNDTGWYDEPTWDFLANMPRPITAAALDCTNAKNEGPEGTGHLGISSLLKMRDELIAIRAMAEDATVFATHIGHNGGLLHESVEAALSGTGVDVAYDGLQVDV